MNREEIAWAAGLFEGEGCFSSQQKGIPIALLAMTDKDVVDRFADVVGFGNVYPRKPELPGRKIAWQWRIAGFERVQYVFAMFWPWLGIRRRKRAVQLLEAAKSKPT